MEKHLERTLELWGRLAAVLSSYQRLLIVGHDHPDPDFLGAALALKHLARTRLRLPSTIVSGGVLGRAENRAMARLLRIRLAPLDEAHLNPHTALILLDTQPRTGNTSLPLRTRPAVVIDHHPRRHATQAPFVDIRPEYGATSSILAEYCQALAVELPSGVATALTYGIAAETLDLSRETGDRDLDAYRYVSERANRRTLAQIAHPKVSRYYFAAINQALRSAFYYRTVIGARLGEVDQPDVIAQVADLLLTHERMSWAICTGFFKGQILVSVRSSSGRANLGTLMRRVVGRRGTAGGHEHSAAAQLDCRDLLPAERLRLEETLLVDFLHRVTHQQDVEPRPLIP